MLMQRFHVAVLATSLTISASTLLAQDQRRPNHGERARPSLEREEAGKRDGRPWLQTASINYDANLFLNRNVIDEPTGTQVAPQNESSIAINPVDPSILIASAVDARPGALVYISTDRGRSWVNKNLGLVRPNWISGNDPSVGWDWMGNGYVMYGAFPPFTVGQGGQSGIYIAKTTDNGASWNAHIPVIEHVGTMTADSAFEDKYYIQIDNASGSPFRGWMYTPWKRVIDRDSSTQIMIARSTDFGMTWSVPHPVSPRKPGTSLDTTFGQSFPLMATGPDGTVYVCWNDGPLRSIGFARSTDAGLTWTSPTYPVSGYPTLGTARKVGNDVYHVLKQTFRAETYPVIVVDNSSSPRAGWVYLVWSAGLYPDVFFQRSTDRGETWSTPVVVHSDTSNDQWWPWISVDQTNGDVAIMYSDSRNDTANILIDQYVSYSSDGGSTWIDRRATDAQSDFRLNPYANRIFAGDYSGNAFHDGRVFPSFLDTRDDNDVYTALVNVRQPRPVEHLMVSSRMGSRAVATLTWDPLDAESVFGVTLDTLWFSVYRDGALRATLPEQSWSFVDTVASLDTVYLYTVRVVTPDDTSVDRSVCYAPKDLARPLGPVVVSYSNIKPTFAMRLLLPTRRGDSVSPLEDLAGVRLYRDGAIIDTRALNASDTGSTIELIDNPSTRGYYRYWATVVDASDTVMESMGSDTVEVYIGPLDPYAEHFDGDRPLFRYGGPWGVTSTIAQSQPASLTDSPDRNYEGRLNSSVWLWPVNAAGSVQLRFNHIAIVDPGDTAFVELSQDSGMTWRSIAVYTWEGYPSWSDGTADAGDWRGELFTLRPDVTANVMVVRFRLKTSVLRHADGWYIDDVEFGQPASVHNDANAADGLTLRPNPARNAAFVEFHSDRAGATTIVVFDAMGRVVVPAMTREAEAGTNVQTIDVSRLPAGSYFLELSTAGRLVRSRLTVIR